MILKDNYAIVENIQEYFFFYSMKTDGELFYVNRSLLMQTVQVTKQHVKEKLQIKKGENYFCFQSMDLQYQKNSLPDYLQCFNGLLKEKKDRELYTLYVYSIAVNILTINKTIAELYDLGKWCGLWE